MNMPDPKTLSEATLRRMLKASSGTITLRDYRAQLVLELARRRKK
jgi:hypothetical protein